MVAERLLRRNCASRSTRKYAGRSPKPSVRLTGRRTDDRGLTPNDLPTLGALAERLLGFGEHRIAPATG